MSLSKPKKQHFIPKVYLKYFSELNDGKNLYVFDQISQYRKYIQTVDSGNALFREENYYTSFAFDDPFIIERIFSQDFESNYNSLINEISKRQNINDCAIKMTLLRWFIFGKLRSPVIRECLESLYLKYNLTPEKVSKLAKEAHLDMFANSEILSQFLNDLLPGLLSMNWEIISTSDEFPFLTSDSPGFSMKLDLDDLNTLNPIPFWKEVTVNSVQFLPLSKNFCLEISAFKEGTDLKQNFSNTPIFQREADSKFVDLINVCTAITSKLLISSNKDLLKSFLGIQ